MLSRTTHRAADRRSQPDVPLTIGDTPWAPPARLPFRRTRIVATIGPASEPQPVLRALIEAGMDIARINFSHGQPEKHQSNMRRIRRLAAQCGRLVSILADLCGPKLRVGELQNGQVELREGSRIRLTARPVIGTQELIPCTYAHIGRDTRPGERILLDDGNLELRVLRTGSDGVDAEVIHGGILKNRKGMNLPDSRLRIPALTSKDRRDVRHALAGGADYLALSFVRTAQDVRSLKHLIRRLGADTPLLAKIEKPEALDEIDAILEAADGIMIARGDLGVELPAQRVPLIQSALIERANRLYKPVIVATQMLESMVERPRPTRAEVTDVATACLADVDAVMLSAETAVGRFPVEAVRTMDTILREAEAYQFYTHQGLFKNRAGFRRDELLNALSVATAQLSRDLRVRGIVVLTRTGRTARVVSADRPAAPIFALTHSPTVAHRINLLWGVYPQRVRPDLSFRDFVRAAEALARQSQIAQSGDILLLLSGLTAPGNAFTNSLTIHRIA